METKIRMTGCSWGPENLKKEVQEFVEAFQIRFAFVKPFKNPFIQMRPGFKIFPDMEAVVFKHLRRRLAANLDLLILPQILIS